MYFSIDKKTCQIGLITLLIVTVAFNISGQETNELAMSDQAPKLDSFLNIIETLDKEDTTYLKGLSNLVRYLRQRDTDLAIQYAGTLVEQSEATGNVRYLAEGKNILGVCHSMQGNFLQALSLMQQASAIAEKNDLVSVLGATKINLGIVHKSMNDFPQSIKYYHEAWKIYDQNEITRPLARISNNLGNLYMKMGDMEKSLYYLKDAREKYGKDDPKGYSSAQLNRGIWYLKNDSLSQARRILDSVLLDVVTNNLVSEEILALTALGEVFVKENNVQKASYYLDAAIEKGTLAQRRDVVFTCLSRFATLWANQGDFSRSLSYINEAEQVAGFLKSVSVSRDLSHDKFLVFEQFGDWKNALNSYEEYVYWTDSIQNEEQRSQFMSQQIEFEITQKDKELETQELELALLKSKLLLRTRGQWVLGIISILLLLIGFLYYNKYRARNAFASKLHQKNNLITTQKKEIDDKNAALEEQYRIRKKIDDTIYSFASSLSSKNSVDDVVKEMIDKCISQLGFVEGSIFMIDQDRKNLVLKSTLLSPQSGKEDTIFPIGLGLPGIVAQNGVASISTGDQSKMESSDESESVSEIAVPLIHEGDVIGVWYSTHPAQGFFTSYHLDVLRTVSSLCASKIAQVQANEERQNAQLMQLEGEKAKELNEMKSRFFANVSHEFRTPLHLILAPLEDAKKDPISESELQMMRRNSRRLLRLVNQLLDLTKIEHQQLLSENKNIEIFGFISEIAKSFLPLAQQNNIQFQIDIPERDYVSQCDPDHLEKIIYNLLSNAFKFTPDGNQINIHLHHEKHKKINLTISDTGIGIPEKQIPHIFDRFYQVEEYGQDTVVGTGIGLSLTKELVDLMGGEIEVDSKPGKGSIFTLKLPLLAIEDDLHVEDISPAFSFPIDAVQNSTFEPDNTLQPGNDVPLLLLVDDHAEMRNYVAQQLSEHCKVLVARDGEIGLELALKHVPDLIITDLMMPKMNGLALLREIRDSTQTSHIPVILLTAKDDSLTRTEGFLSGVEQFLGKPFELKELKARIKGLLEQREILKEKFRKLNLLATTESDLEDRDQQFLDDLVAIIEQNLDNESFSVQTLQRAIGMSRMQLHRKLKALVDHSTSELIRKVRLHHAAQYLSQPGYQVAEVAQKVGFTHMSYFAKCFKDQYGKPPSEFGVSE